MSGKTYNIDITNPFINQLVYRVLEKYYNYTDEFWISDGIKQIVHGIYYTIKVDLHSMNKRIILRFLHKAWEEENKEITFIRDS